MENFILISCAVLELLKKVSQGAESAPPGEIGLNEAVREYHEVFGHELPLLPREPVLSDFYTPSDEQHYRELGFITLSMIGIGGVLYYFES